MLAYLDHAATGPLRPEATDAMLPWLTGRFGNPSGMHAVAQAARAAIDDARDRLGACLGMPPGGIVFTSGGTEAVNLAVRGSLAAEGGAVVTSAIEHAAVLRSVEAAAAADPGLEVRIVGVGGDGTVDVDELRSRVDRSVRLVSVMAANNEVGSIQPLGDVVRATRRRAPRALVHTDAVAALPWLEPAAFTAGVDLVSISAHKFGGPQGVGALAMAPGISLRPLIVGGGQEREQRAGTQNVAGIVGMAAALEAALAARDVELTRVGALRDRLVRRILDGLPAAVETIGEPRMAGHAHLRFAGVHSEELLIVLDELGVAASAGSACASGAMEPSHVLLALGLSEEEALSSLRLTLGPETTEVEVDQAAQAVVDAVTRLRDASNARLAAPAGRV